MKRIVICFDGTANRHDAGPQTNVVLIARAVAERGHDEALPLVQYHLGVGTGRGTNRASKMLDRTLGGALAFGLVDVVEEAYRALAFAYERGDAIQIFGFSRGAFTARVFAGLLRSCGIPRRSTVGAIPQALDRHLSKAAGTHPDDPESIAFRRWFAPDTATSARELAAPGRRDEDGAIRLFVDYMGLWDTVKSFARPQRVEGMREPVPRLFHDLDLSSMVLSARHAVSIDERRALYPNWNFRNFDALNARHPSVVPRYQQVWFPGDHGSVGGGGTRVGLSSIAFRWVALGAARAGLRLLPADMMRLAWRMAPGDPLANRLAPGGLLALLLTAMKQDRPGPSDPAALSVAALDRWRADPAYRPRTLRAVTRALEGMDEGARDALRARLVARDGGLTHDPGAPWWLPWPDEPGPGDAASDQLAVGAQ